MTSVLHRSIAHSYPVAARGQGMHIWDDTGKQYIDASGGAAVSCLGHSHPDVLAAMHAQLDKLAYAHTSFFTTQVAEELGEDLVAHGPPGTSHVYFVSGGSEAMEAALKMARQYFVEIGEPERRHFIARKQSYHGNTLGALAVGGNEWRRKQFAPLLIDDAPRLALLRVSRPPGRRDAAPVRRAPRPGARGQDPGAGAQNGDRLRGRDRRRGHGGRHPAGRGLLQARARGLRPPRHPADPGRGDVRHGPHRHAARLRAGRHRTGPDGDRQGAGRRLRADRRRAGAGTRSSTRSRRARVSSSTATPISAIRWPAPARWPSRR